MHSTFAQEKPIDITQLSDYVKTGNLTPIKALVTQFRALKGWRWWHGVERMIDCAVRDAILLGHIDIVRYFLEEGISPDVFPSISGTSGPFNPLIFFAVRAGNLEIVQLLVDAGASIVPSEYDDNDDGIRVAVLENQTDIALYLLEKGATPHGVVNTPHGETFLARAAANSNYRLVEALINKNASVAVALRNAAYKYQEDTDQYEEAISLQQSKQNFYVREGKRDKQYKKYYTNDLAKCTHKLMKLEQKFKEIKKQYYQTVFLLLDYAMGIDFTTKQEKSFFLEDLDISGFNFVGVSFDGKPVTHDVLTGLRLKNAEKALVTLKDVTMFAEPTRQATLTNRIHQKIQQCGLIDLEGVLNLVPLWQAATIGDANTVLVRLAAGTNPNEKSQGYYEKIIPIVSAAKKGHFAVIELLANHPNIDKKDMVTAIWEAKKNHFPAVANYLAERQDVNIQDNEGNTLLHKAAAQGDVDEVSKLLVRGADVTVINKKGHLPLILAVKGVQNYEEESIEHVRIITLLLNQAQDNTNYINKACAQALFDTVKEGAVQTTDFLLSAMTEKPHSTYIETQVPWYSDFVFNALDSMNAIGILTVLKKHGAEFNIKNDDEDTLLNRAIRELPSYHTIVNTIHKLAITTFRVCEDRLPKDILKTTEQQMLADAKKIFSRELKLIDFLLANGADPKRADKQGLTPLHTLVQAVDLQHLEKSYEEVMDRLLVNIDALDEDDNTPLHLAASSGNVIAINYLVLHGAKLNVQNKQGQTPLHIAANKGFLSATTTLLHLSADISLLDEKQNTPFMLLNEYYQETIYELQNWRKQRDLEDTFNTLRNEFNKAKDLHVEWVKIKLTKQISPFVYYMSHAPELFRQVIRHGKKTFAQIDLIVQEVVPSLDLTPKAQTLLARSLFEINRIAYLASPYLHVFKDSSKGGEVITTLVYDLAIKALADKAKHHQEKLQKQTASSNQPSTLLNVLRRSGSPLHQHEVEPTEAKFDANNSIFNSPI